MPNNPDAYNWLASVLRKETPGWPDMKNISFEEQIWLAGLENGVLALCFHILSQSSRLERIPPTLRLQLKQYTMQEAAVELIQNQELKNLLELFDNVGIQTLLIKGSPLSYTIYSRPYLRTRCDTDLLFHDKKNAEKAWQLMKKEGYEKPTSISGDLVSYEFSCVKSTPNNNIRTAIDLHWRLSNNQYIARTFSFNELLNSSVPVPDISIHAYTLNTVHALILALMHRASHKTEGTANRLIWLYDIHLLCDNLDQCQWNDFLIKVTEKKVCGICLDGLIETQKFLDTQIPDEICSTLCQMSKNETLTIDRMRTQGLKTLTDFRTLTTWEERFQLIKEHLLPSKEYMFSKYNTKNRFKLPFLYLIRIAQGIPKLFK